MSNASIIYNSEHVLSILKYYSSKNYTSNNNKSKIAEVGNNLYKRSEDRAFNNTDNISKHINQYTTDVVDGSKYQQSFESKRKHFIFLLKILVSINIVPFTLIMVSFQLN